TFSSFLIQRNITGTTAANATEQILTKVNNDYDYDDQTTETPVQPVYTSCDYNPCRHLQKPCSELQSASQCLCPGISREDEVPDPPRLRDVSEVTDSSAQIHWCAPNSVVHTYQLMLHAQGNEESTKQPGCSSPTSLPPPTLTWGPLKPHLHTGCHVARPAPERPLKSLFNKHQRANKDKPLVVACNSQR
uniref:Uncharacterized protein n=1 Tax=Apteryx owenii TaxID=8824 RepID=A0A8B9SBD2_APTOW